MLRTRACALGNHEACRKCECTCHTKPPTRGNYISTGKLVDNFEDALHKESYVSQSADVTQVRPSRDKTLLAVARVLALRGTCSRAQVGAVIARNGRIISTGYNGAPAGMPHCVHESWKSGLPIPNWVTQAVESIRKDSPEWLPPQDATFYLNGDSATMSTGGNSEAPGCNIVEHAERNAIAYAARYGVGTDQSTLYSTHEPCIECARAIVNAGIIRVIYETPYRKHDGTQLLTQAGVEVIQFKED